MSTEQERLGSDAADESKASRVDIRMSELPADVQDQELDGDNKQEGCVVVEPGASSAGDDLGMTKEKESVNGSSDLVLGTTTKESEKKEVSVNVEKEEPDIKQGTEAESLDDIECFMGLDPYESKDESALDTDDNTPVTLKVKLSDSDLVWAKVRSHPWWPGQVFDASAATDKAKKHFKKGSFLVTYFGDCSFAWNDASKVKPFRHHFSQMAKQSSLPSFVDAVDFALEEVSRRIEFGLACSCISEEVYQRIKTQKIINPGIREDYSIVQGGDKVSSAELFEPAELVEYVKRLACSPSYDPSSDELQFVSQRARLLAFNRWKGYTDLPEFETLQGSVESAPKISPEDTEVKESAPEPKKKKSKQVKESSPEPKKSKQVYTKRRKTEDKDQCKLDGVFEYEDTTTTVVKKKEKTLAEFIAEKRLSKSHGKRSDENAVRKQDGEKKRKVVHSEPAKSSSAKRMKTEDSGSPMSPPKNDQKITPMKAKTSFGIGESILRVANQMHCSTPTGLVPCSKNNSSGKSKPKREPSLSETLSSRHSASTTKASSGKPNLISIDKLQSGQVSHVGKETPNSELVEESMSEVKNLKGSSDEKMVNEEAASIVGEMTSEDSKQTEEKITGSDLKVKEQHVNKNCPEESSA
ncbi:Tudor/PWWP/MBT superfamily protein [Raphanus sativus]|uniref:PWWP domain-containing protein 2 n=1 Tax=Raphanus sativus TaxID=3726 RepID=A0A6J0JAG4_RAPSA|nr:PWWP domain-containing protein 2 [Raphanus sativus]KAJ4898318.1 Tudor/PWWP/MBT superfamily protein [Raphanus sativus]